MNHHVGCARYARPLALAALFAASLAAAAQAQQPAAPAQPPIKLGIVSFLTGPAAGPFGVPGRNAAEVLIEALNAGKVPAPYNSVGLGGTQIEAKFVDEAGSTANQVTEFRNMVQRDNVDAVVGYVASGNCLAVVPVAEELKTLTVLYDCGTPRIFEEKPYKYVFRATPHATMDSVGAARYALERMKDITAYSGINQNYAWGQDSWRDFVLAMKVLAPKAAVKVREVWDFDPLELLKDFSTKWGLELDDRWHAFDQQPVPIDHIETRSCFRFGQAIRQHRLEQQRADPDAGRTAAQHGDAMLGQRHTRHIHGCHQGAGGHDGGTLDVIIEGAQPVPIALQQPGRVIARKIIPLQQHMRPALD